MADQTVIKFNRNGDPASGLEPWDPMPAEGVESGNPVQNGYQFFETANKVVTAGVWDCTPYAEKKGPYSVDEFMVLLDGSLDIEQPDGETIHFSTGDSFVIPKGAIVQWQQSEYLRKFWFIHDTPETATGSLDRAALLDIKADLPRMPQADSAMFVSAVPDMGMEVVYQSADKKMIAGVWDSTAMTRVPGTIERSELMHIIEGSGHIKNADDIEYHFSAGDTFLVPAGMGYQWHSDEYVKKTFCSFTA